jgi:hypothetical protein
VGTLSNDDERFTLSELSVVVYGIAHLVLPVLCICGLLRNKQEISATTDGSKQCQPAAVTTHYLDHEGSGMG